MSSPVQPARHGPPRRGGAGTRGLIAVLLFLDGVLLGAVVGPHVLGVAPGPDRVAHDHAMKAGETRGTERSDLRVAAAFAALEREGLGAALDTLERAAAADSVVLQDGHQLAHALGRMAAARGDASAIRQCRPDFASGCFHGVVEATVQARGRVDMAELERMCLGAGGDENPGAVHECMHGLGHGVLGATGFDLATGLRDCDRLGPAFASWCYSGAFMEAINDALGESRLGGGHAHAGMDHAAHAGDAGTGSLRLTIDAKDPYSPCDRFDDPYATECWVFQGFVILQAQDHDAAKASLVCDQAPRQRVASCYESLGLQLTGLYQRDDAWVIAQCARGRRELAPRCGAGAARALVQIDWSGDRASRFCAAVPADWKDACYESAARTLTAFAGPTVRATACAAVEAPFVEPCRRAAGLAPRG